MSEQELIQMARNAGLYLNTEEDFLGGDMKDPGRWQLPYQTLAFLKFAKALRDQALEDAAKLVELNNRNDGKALAAGIRTLKSN